MKLDFSVFGTADSGALEWSTDPDSDGPPPRVEQEASATAATTAQRPRCVAQIRPPTAQTRRPRHLRDMLHRVGNMRPCVAKALQAFLTPELHGPRHNLGQVPRDELYARPVSCGQA